MVAGGVLRRDPISSALPLAADAGFFLAIAPARRPPAPSATPLSRSRLRRPTAVAARLRSPPRRPRPPFTSPTPASPLLQPSPAPRAAASSSAPPRASACCAAPHAGALLCKLASRRSSSSLTGAAPCSAAVVRAILAVVDVEEPPPAPLRRIEAGWRGGASRRAPVPEARAGAAQKRGFAVALTPDEIAHDFAAIRRCATRPAPAAPRRSSKKRTNRVQNAIDVSNRNLCFLP
nr:uncharacterized protein LOC127347999 [Lolium perenne]